MIESRYFYDEKEETKEKLLDLGLYTWINYTHFVTACEYSTAYYIAPRIYFASS